MDNTGKRSWFRKILRALVLVFAALILAFIAYVAVVSIDHPPDDLDLSVLHRERKQYGDQLFVLGDNWLRKSESGLWECYLEGESFERGVAFGMLTRELLYYQESVFVDQIRELVPSDFYLKILKYFIAFFNRNLEQHIIREYRNEIYGTSLSCDPAFDFIGTRYQRQLNYHAAHDIGHALTDFNLTGCTSFSVWDDKSADSSLIVGRNFDFYMGDGFAENKIVCFVNPSAGYKFMMITWADMVGVVSGMNEKGLTVTINAAKSAVPSHSSTPVTLVTREILQYAASISEAFEIAKKRETFVSESIMIASSVDGHTVIIEKSPDVCVILYPEDNQIISTNHFQSEHFADDERNVANINGSDSYDRYQRVRELLEKTEAVDVQSAVNILRDQKALDDQNIGMGNQLAINQLIAHHSVVFKPDSLLVWVSTPPFQLGRFVAYDLKEIFSLDTGRIIQNLELYLPERTLPADNFLFADDYRNYLVFREMTRELNRYRKDEEPLPPSFENDYLRLNPEYYGTYANLGDYYRKLGKYDLAGEFYDRALTKAVSGLDEERRIAEKAAKMLKK
ncbi:MAG: choloylglycine hydrolase [Bacteroidales bacterium]|nr:choloylglycine hydrolase [Bacteroidales bacterium]